MIRYRLGPKLMPAIGLLVLCVLTGLLGFSVVEAASRQLLEAEARIDAQRWSKHLAATLGDLSVIAGGAAPEPQLLERVNRSLAGDHLLSFRIYDAKGKLRLQSDAPLGASVVGSPSALLDRGFATALQRGSATTLLRQGEDKSGPTLIASSLLPLAVGQQTLGWLEVNIDQTERQELFSAVTTKASIAVSLLLIAGPIFGFWYRAREKAMMEKTIVNLAQHDRLTGLLLKSAFLERMEKWLNSELPANTQSAVILCELTGATGVVEGHGQDAGDALIVRAAERLSAIAVGKGDIAVAGHGSFLVLVRNVADPMLVLSLAKEITIQLSAPVEYKGVKLNCQSHSGIALSSTDGSTAQALVRCAEMALLSAKEQGTPGYGFYNREIAKDADRRTAVRRAVADATATQGFRLEFQPVYTIRTGELNGFEALIRLHDAELGNISPAEFIPIAEQAGLIRQIGAWCLEEACRIAAQWPPHLMVAVNLSPSQFLSGSLINDVRKALENNQFPGYRLEVEITEGTLLHDSELVLSQLRVLRDMGVAVALDDFGTGYSSLSYLWKFPFSKLKIDRSFIVALDESQSAKGILRTIVKLGHGLGLTVTAEGIENGKQLNTLRDLGCDLAQGYLLDRPARVADLAAIILRNFANGLNRRTRDTGSGKNAA